MFKFLKEKLKKAVSMFSKKVEEEADIKEEVKEVEEPVQEIKEEIIEAPEKWVKEEVSVELKEEKTEPFEVEIDVEVKKELESPSEEILEATVEEELNEAEEIKEEIEKDIEEELKEEDIIEEDVHIEIKEEFIPEEEKEEFIEDVSLEKEVSQIKKKIFEEEREIEKEKEEKKEKEKPKQSFFKKLFGKKEQPQAEEKKPELEKEVKVEPKEEIKEEKKEPETVVETSVEEEPEKKGFFKKIKETFTTVKLSEEKFEKLFWELELVLLENNVAVEVIDKIKADLKEDLTTGKVSRKNLYDLIEDSLRESVQSLFMESHFNLVEEIKKKKAKPYIITFIGVNGSGKTTNMAKVAHLLQKNNLKVVFAASDTFRAAAIQQLEEHANNLGIKMIKHDYESDPAAVAFDAIEHAKAKGIDVVMIDTAGRLHSNDNLMNELKKLIRVNKPDLNIFVGESITGNDCVEQAKLFDEAVGIDAIILAKADVDEKGGAAVSVSYVTKKPIIFLGTGQTYDDLTPFKPEIIIKNIGL